MSEPLPALCLIAVPGRRRRTIELCQETERRGFAGIYVPSPFGNMSMCEALAWNTESITFGTAIAPIYQRTIVDFAQSAAMMHEVSGGRFRLGIGIAHGPSHVRMGVTPGKPLADTRAFIEKFRAAGGVRSPAADHRRGAAQADGGAGGRARRGRGVRQRVAVAHGPVAGGAAGGQAQRSGLLHRQHDPDLHQRRRRGRQGGQPAHAHQLRLPAELPELLEGSRLRRGNGRRSRRRSPKAAATTCRNISPTNGWPTTRCSARRRRCARASPPGARRACTRRSWCRPRRPATR